MDDDDPLAEYEAMFADDAPTDPAGKGKGKGKDKGKGKHKGTDRADGDGKTQGGATGKGTGEDTGKGEGKGNSPAQPEAAERSEGAATAEPAAAEDLSKSSPPSVRISGLGSVMYSHGSFGVGRCAGLSAV